MTEELHNYFMPAEWERQKSVILSYPLNPETWESRREAMEKAYVEFVAAITKYEDVKINCIEQEQSRVMETFSGAGADCSRITFLPFATNDAWCRDHGPIFIKNRNDHSRAILDFAFNAWGGKFPWDLDNAIPGKIAKYMNLPCFSIPFIVEGGALEVNGAGTLLTTESVLLNPNRNFNFSMEKAEEVLKLALGVEQILWLKSGLDGDDTDGHIDTLTRFFRKDAVLTSVDYDKTSSNYEPLQRNLKDLKKMRLADGSKLDILELPSPKQIRPEVWREEVLPASYANFLIINGAVLVPTYRQDQNDKLALKIIGEAFPERDIVPVDCFDIVLEGGALHCLSQQEPE